MKTNFRPRNSVRGAERKRFAIVAGACALALLIFVFGRSFVVRVISPLWQAQNSLSTELRTMTELVRSKEALAEENEALKQQLTTFDTLLASYRTVEVSREEILARYGRANTNGGIAAGVLAHPPQTPYDILIIDAGESEGVQAGMRVSLPEGGALGVIEEAFAHQSRVSLYTRGSEHTPAVLERGNVPVALIGKGGGTFSIEVPREIVVEAEDKILLPGLRAELVGFVSKIDAEPTDSVLRITAAGVGNIFGVRFVIVH